MAGASHEASGETALTANDPCPFAPQPVALTAPSLSAMLAAGADPARLASELCLLLAATAFAVLASRRSQPKRGPPCLEIL